jgi:hypothetical protein
MYKLLKVANIGDKSQYIIVEYVMEIYWEKIGRKFIRKL